eukprot:16436804-Heterocapsa_arctica.AAC.1
MGEEGAPPSRGTFQFAPSFPSKGGSHRTPREQPRRRHQGLHSAPAQQRNQVNSAGKNSHGRPADRIRQLHMAHSE